MEPKEELYEAFHSIPWFSSLKENHRNKIAGISHIKHFRSGERFFHEGDRQDFIYVLTSGRVALDMFVPHHGKVRFSSVEKWDVFGWSSVTPNVHQRTAGAVAVLDGAAVAMDAEKLRLICEADTGLGYLVMRRLAGVVASRLMETRLQLIDMFGATETKNEG